MEIYVVKSGDTLYNIARRYSATVEDLVYANQLADPAMLMVGQALIIPQGQRTHTVRRGQTLYSIAQSYGVSLQRLLAANPSIDPNRIYPGQSIIIPATGQDLGEIVVNGYITDATDSTLSAQLPYLTFLSPFSFRTDAEGNLTQTFSVNTSLSEGERTANLMTVTNLKAQGGFSSDIAHAILTSQTTQDDFLDNIETKLAQGGWYGINIDFEYIYQWSIVK
ncbi:MAG: LysM peptidoglycan-binding domain-containing protein [Oscillospiraceae bacterium]|nr:LysM peptidoglycan-binding domain-containing protein [Oscillospiraceae bacterium]